ncbi:hypothetical protein chiPu_0024308, partial [Chiloscyllium punctatum]|nr:hypothetical protein [Chiloscyllium punctatum]
GKGYMKTYWLKGKGNPGYKTSAELRKNTKQNDNVSSR